VSVQVNASEFISTVNFSISLPEAKIRRTSQSVFKSGDVVEALVEGFGVSTDLREWQVRVFVMYVRMYVCVNNFWRRV
jgi:hypothetical protein